MKTPEEKKHELDLRYLRMARIWAENSYSRLRLFIAENRSVEIIHLLGKSLVEEPVFKEGANHA